MKDIKAEQDAAIDRKGAQRARVPQPSACRYEAEPAGVFTAPGHDVPTTQPNGKWFLVNGSSYAAAHVSGLFALMRERDPRARTAAWLVTRRPGGGAIDACATLVHASGPCACACATAASGPSPRS